MSLIVPLPKCVAAHRGNCTHPGLLLDKFVESYDALGQVTQKWQESVQKPTAKKVVELSQHTPDSFDFTSLVQRWQQTLRHLGALMFRCTTTGPLTLHLSRASALENAGICLHPLYGFAYLPGSGLKGMARAYAETVWSPTQDDAQKAWARIEAVFGWGPSSDRGKDWKPQGIPARPKDDNARVGTVVFHDAWPTAWPPLIVDIVNNHHPDYYQHDDNQHAPGDWENPVPVYFLAVKPGTRFTFPLSKRSPDVPEDLVDLAHQWLLGALCHLGAGAKTNAGYGAFKPADGIEDTPRNAVEETWQSATAKPAGGPRRAVFETTLELVTPAFLAGADQYGAAAQEGCDLRPATLRGHLRWWWRAMHAGFLDVKTLRALEAAMWGDTHAGGAVRIELSPCRRGSPSLYSHPQEHDSGTRYVAYGMDERSRGQRRQRYLLKPPASWALRLIARPTEFFVNRQDAKDPQKHGTCLSG